ncbi:FAM115C-like protein [Platysternon megacephalum]|uniref:FAM115C-like protein n=1 Tax=Platysternon megacephalum TaxID=55544 RepID=A0A4D9DVT4_9SAUR|nr:FAM115C-like protein [Platysternon megacephalum]
MEDRKQGLLQDQYHKPFLHKSFKYREKILREADSQLSARQPNGLTEPAGLSGRSPEPQPGARSCRNRALAARTAGGERGRIGPREPPPATGHSSAPRTGPGASPQPAPVETRPGPAATPRDG